MILLHALIFCIAAFFIANCNIPILRLTLILGLVLAAMIAPIFPHPPITWFVGE